MRTSALCAALLTAAIAASPAAAIDTLTGVWTGKLTCDATDSMGVRSHSKADTSLAVDDAADGNAYGYLNNTAIPLRLAVITDGDKPELARVAGPSCGISSDVGGFFFQASVKVKPGSSQGTMSGSFQTVTVGAGPHTTSACRFKLKRTDTTISGPISCP